jgi:hypothetical protein
MKNKEKKSCKNNLDKVTFIIIIFNYKIIFLNKPNSLKFYCDLFLQLFILIFPRLFYHSFFSQRV